MCSRFFTLWRWISAALLLCVFCLLVVPASRAGPNPDTALLGTCVDQIRNGSFEATSFLGWTTGGTPQLWSQGGHTGWHSALLGGTNQDYDEISQELPCPYYGEKVVAHAWVYMSTQDWEESADWLELSAYDTRGAGGWSYLYNNNMADTWWEWRHTSSGPHACEPGVTWTVRFRAETDEGLPTWFFVDDVSLEVCCPDDTFEPNDSFATAHGPVTGTMNVWLCPNGDEDWFQFDAVSGKTIAAQLTRVGSTPGELCLYRPDGSQAGCSPAYIERVADQTGSWRVRVYDPGGGTSTAATQLQVQVSGPPPVGGNVAAAVTPSDATPNIGGSIVATINIDMSDVTPAGTALGSFTGSLDWDPAVLQYVSNSGLLAGFTGAVNASQASSGHIVFNGAKATGATGNTVVLTLTFNAVGAGTSPLNLGFSAMATADSFVDLLPLLSITDGEVVPGGVQHSLTVAVSPVGGGTTNPFAGVHTYPAGSVVNVTAWPSFGYTFVYWSGDCTGSGPCSVTMDADRGVTANFALVGPQPTPTATPPGWTGHRVYLPVVLRRSWQPRPEECAELLWNGDFEGNGLEGWSHWGDVGLGPGHNSANGPWLGGRDNAEGELWQWVNVPAGADAVPWDFWWKAEAASPDPDDQVRAYVESEDVLTPLLYISAEAPLNVWRHATVDLTPWAGKRCIVTFQLLPHPSVPTIFRIDGVSVRSCVRP
jgi:hypothetical protein